MLEEEEECGCSPQFLIWGTLENGGSEQGGSEEGAQEKEVELSFGQVADRVPI